MRDCIDLVYSNSQQMALQVNAPRTQYMIQKAAGHCSYWYTDGEMQYKGLGLDPDSRDVLAVWTPL